MLKHLLPRLLLGADYRLFDPGFYRRNTPELGWWRCLPLLHYLLRGWREGRDPHPLFLGDWYRTRYLAAKPQNPLWHYIRQGGRAGCEPHPLFDTGLLLRQTVVEPGSRITPLARYLEGAGDPALQPFPLFDQDYYRKANPSAALAWPTLLLLHYLAHGAEEGSRPNALFDPDFYRQQYLTPDATRLAALLHYADEGRRAGFRPNACFDPEFYRRQMQAAGQTGDPLLHYLRQGLHEGRYPCPEVAALARRQRPCISILTPVYNTSENQLWRCVHSVLMQPWPYWQLCLVDDGSTEAHVAPLLAGYARLDPRIRVAAMPENSGIAAATNRAAELAEGEWLAFLDHDDELALDALYQVARMIDAEEPDALYSDERLINLESRPLDTLFKCALNRELLRTHNHLMHFFVLRRRLFQELGGLDPDCDGAQDYDLALRVAERSEKIRHIPRVLYHWRAHASSTSIHHEQKAYAGEAGRRALAASLMREHLDARAEATELHFFYRTRRRLPECGRVSVCGDGALPESCRAALQDSWPELEWLEPAGGNSPVEWRNRAAARAEGRYLLFVGAEVRRLRPECLTALLEYGQDMALGLSAGWLEQPAGPHRHRGSLPDLGNASPLYYASFLRDVSVQHNRFHCAQYAWAVAEQLFLVRRGLFLAGGGYDPAFRTLAFAQLDLCFRLHNRGLRHVYTPWAVAECGPVAVSEALLGAAEADRLLLQARWKKLLNRGDPWYNRNLLACSGVSEADFTAWFRGRPA